MKHCLFDINDQDTPTTTADLFMFTGDTGVPIQNADLNQAIEDNGMQIPKIITSK